MSGLCSLMLYFKALTVPAISMAENALLTAISFHVLRLSTPASFMLQVAARGMYWV